MAELVAASTMADSMPFRVVGGMAGLPSRR
jgi:hypothetical protein